MEVPSAEAALPLVVVMDFISDIELEREVLRGVARVEAWNISYEADIPEKMKEVSAVLLWHYVHFEKEGFERISDKLKAIIRVGMGFDTVDLRRAGELGIPVVNVPDYGTEEVADSALCGILNLMRRFHWLANGTAQGRWPTLEAAGSTRLRGKVLGIIGLGKIGKAVALRAKPFGFNVIFYDPFIEDGEDKSLGVGRAESLAELMATADVISVNCNLHKDNFHLLDETAFGYIPKNKGAYFVNTARGALVDENALRAALTDGRLKAAAIDVLEKEPYTDGHLSDLPNLILTPHTAFYCDEGFKELRTKAALEAKRVLQGLPPRNCVNKHFLKTT
eukprot:TRINITY_DN7423_c0_g1_i1.p1 TRINITY_DN7423_c0_g1~~TRINITY_DN7423_c0_g1_i1.p1  ORF type:complete len:376 (+),score=85.52 TRINITY_DN7423_c0_g1_i1:125-1129(+)